MIFGLIVFFLISRKGGSGLLAAFSRGSVCNLFVVLLVIGKLTSFKSEKGRSRFVCRKAFVTFESLLELLSDSI